MTTKLHSYPTTPAQAGWQAEKICRLHFISCGYHVLPGNDGCDLIARHDDGEIVRIEVKGARKGKDKKWHFTLFKEGHTDARKSNVVFLVQFHPGGIVALYLVPVAFFEGKTFACITSEAGKYRGKLRPFQIVES